MCIAHKAKVMVKTKRHVIKSYHVRGCYSLFSIMAFLVFDNFHHYQCVGKQEGYYCCHFSKLTRVVYIAWDRLWSTSWVGKIYRQKAMFSAVVPCKAAVKVNLPISVLYAVVWLLRTVIRRTCGY